MELGAVMEALYASEINCSISSFWDNHFDVKLGDEMNGFAAEENFETTAEAAAWLDAAARLHYPNSVYAVGKEEWERLNAARQNPPAGSNGGI